MEKRICNGEKDFLASGVGESDLTESESHLNMMKDGGSALQSILNPPLAPSEHSSSLVNYLVCVLGEQQQVPQGSCIFTFLILWGKLTIRVSDPVLRLKNRKISSIGVWTVSVLFEQPLAIV